MTSRRVAFAEELEQVMEFEPEIITEESGGQSSSSAANYLTDEEISYGHIMPSGISWIGIQNQLARGNESMETASAVVNDGVGRGDNMKDLDQVSQSDNVIMETGLSHTHLHTDSWSGSLPSDWIPIINRDFKRQQRQKPQPPLSAIYLNGMPSK